MKKPSPSELRGNRWFDIEQNVREHTCLECLPLNCLVSGIRTVTLLSHSDDIEETDGLVLRVAEATNRLLLREAELLAATSRNVSTGTAFNPQIPTFVGLQEEREAFEAGKPSIIMKNRTIRVKPSQDSNGFFIATLHKEQILLKSGDDLRSDIEQPGKGSKDIKGKGKAKK
ncbi:unnamed protein product, partial [Dicrocoelium dendriticum]